MASAHGLSCSRYDIDVEEWSETSTGCTQEAHVLSYCRDKNQMLLATRWQALCCCETASFDGFTLVMGYAQSIMVDTKTRIVG